MYFIQGIGDPTSGLIAQPVRSLLKSWGDSPTTIAAFMALLALPWSLKVLFGLLSDLVPLFGSRRRNYLLISSISASLGLLFLYLFPVPAGAHWLLFTWLLLPTIGIAFGDVLVDALMVETGQPRGRSSPVDSMDGGEHSAAPYRRRWRISEYRRPTAGGVAVCAALGGQLPLAHRFAATLRTFAPRPLARRWRHWFTRSGVRAADRVRHSVHLESIRCGVGVVSAHDHRPALRRTDYGNTYSVFSAGSVVASRFTASTAVESGSDALHASIFAGMFANILLAHDDAAPTRSRSRPVPHS
jgi:hypothetical protein